MRQVTDPGELTKLIEIVCKQTQDYLESLGLAPSLRVERQISFAMLAAHQIGLSTGLDLMTSDHESDHEQPMPNEQFVTENRKSVSLSILNAILQGGNFQDTPLESVVLKAVAMADVLEEGLKVWPPYKVAEETQEAFSSLLAKKLL